MEKKEPSVKFNTSFMKHSLIILSFLVIVSAQSFSQLPVKGIEFKDGKNAFIKKILQYLDKNNGGYNMASAEIERMSNKYFVVVLNIDKRGRFYDRCSVLSLQDTTNGKIVLAAFRQTDGDWINNTGYKKTVIIPVYFIYVSVEKSWRKTQC